MKIFALTVALVLGLAATAEARQMTAQELQALVRHAQRLNEIYQHGAGVTVAMADAEDILDAFYNGQGSEADVRARLENALRQTRVEIDAYAASLSFIGKRDPLPDRDKESAMQAYESMLLGLKDQLEAQRDNLAEMRLAALAGDSAAYEQANANSMRLYADMLLAENTALDAAQMALAPTHPQMGLNESVIGANLAMRAALLLLEDNLRGGQARVSEATRSIQDGLARAEAGVRRGRDAADAMLASMAGKPVRGEGDEYARKFLVDFVAAYQRAFVIEERLTSESRAFLEALTLAMASEKYLDYAALISAAETFKRNSAPLIDSRTEEQFQRLRLVGEFSANLARLQQ